jgi:arylsulfatase
VRPNILLITTDQQRWDTLGIQGNPVIHTPNLDALAAGGLYFTQAYSTCPVCIPARRTLISGLHPATHGLGGYQDGLDFDPPATLPGLLGKAGYQTQLIGKLHLHPQRKRYGFDHMVLSDSPNERPDSPQQKHNDYITWLHDCGVQTSANAHGLNSNSRLARPWHLAEEYHHSHWLTRRAIHFLTQERDPTAPWFLHLSYSAPHPPLNPPAAYWNRYYRSHGVVPKVGEWACLPQRPGRPPESAIGPFRQDEMDDAITGYYGLIHQIDDCLRWLLDSYREYGTARQKDPIIILFTSDHGEMLGDHHLFRKSLGYEGSAHIPFFISGINFPMARGTVDSLVSLEDVMPTLLELAETTVPEHLDGISLAPLLRGEVSTTRSTLFGECTGIDNHYLVHQNYKYLRYTTTGEEQLFDLHKDPYECHDLSGQPALLHPLRKQLENAWEKRGLPLHAAPGTPCQNHRPSVLCPTD